MHTRAASAALGLALLVLSGCVGTDDKAPAAPGPVPGAVADALVFLNQTAPVAGRVMTFTQSVISPAQAVAADLYEPTMEVSDTGVIYVAAHVIGAATTGTPAWYSRDDGATWTQLPFAGPVSAPPPVQGAQPPPGDEGFIVAGDDGQAWMADIYLAGFSVTGWCDDGGELCYDNRQAYDRITSTSEMCADGADPNASTASSLNDRPWAAYAPGVGQLLLVNNPGGGPMQIGRMQVPPPTPVGGADPVTGPQWNLCASPDGWIPGVPAMRGDGLFAVPQMTGSGKTSRLTVVLGNVDDIFDLRVLDAFHVTSGSGGTSNGGRTAFDGNGTLYVGAYNNTHPRAISVPANEGRFVIAASQDDGQTFVNRTFVTGSPVRSFYLDSHLHGPGALVTWSQLGSTNVTNQDGSVSYTRSDWYVAHVGLDADGAPVLTDISLAVDEGPHWSAHVMGASAGPDGRAYFVSFDDTGLDTVSYVGSTPLSVWIQKDGPTLPVTPTA